jgi:hypothetical protein
VYRQLNYSLASLTDLRSQDILGISISLFT